MSLEYDPQGLALDVRDARHVPWLSVVLGFGPMVPLIMGAVAAWALAPNLGRSAIMLTLIWGGAILAFLSGVRRGLSFRTPGGAQPAQIVTMMGLFMLALASLVVGNLVARTVLLIIGFAAVAVLDPIAALDAETPPFFARLRPMQMAIAVISLIGVLIRL